MDIFNLFTFIDSSVVALLQVLLTLALIDEYQSEYKRSTHLKRKFTIIIKK